MKLVQTVTITETVGTTIMYVYNVLPEILLTRAEGVKGSICVLVIHCIYALEFHAEVY